jgi:hypothetical protein
VRRCPTTLNLPPHKEKLYLADIKGHKEDSGRGRPFDSLHDTDDDDDDDDSYSHDSDTRSSTHHIMEKDDPLASPLKVDSATLPHDEVPEVSMVEAEEVTGVTFAPE